MGIHLTKIALSISLLMLMSNNLMANEVTLNKAELSSFAAQKYKVNFDAQTEQSKQEIAGAYKQTELLSNILANSVMKNDQDLKVATQIATIEIWAQKYMQSISLNKEQMKKLYDKEKPKVSARYNLSNILVKDESSAEKDLKIVASIHDKDKLSKKFAALAQTDSIDPSSKSHDGNIGWIDVNKLQADIQKALKDKKVGDIVKVQIPNLGWQIILVNGYQASRDATLEESSNLLLNIARREALTQEINKLLQNKQKEK